MGSRSESEHEVSRRVKTEFLVQMQGVSNANSNGVLVLGATNLPWSLDSAIRRRFEKRIYIPLPDQEARHCLLVNAMKKEEHQIQPNELTQLGEMTNMFSGSDLGALVKNACMEPLRKFQTATHFREVGRNNENKPVYMPCSPSDRGAQKMDGMKLSGNQVHKNPVSKFDFFKAIKQGLTSL